MISRKLTKAIVMASKQAKQVKRKNDRRDWKEARKTAREAIGR